MQCIYSYLIGEESNSTEDENDKNSVQNVFARDFHYNINFLE